MNQKFGVNKIRKIMRKISEKCQNCRIWKAPHKHKHENVLCPKTQGKQYTYVAPTDIMQVIGHKNVNSINNYSEITVTKQKEMSKILSTTKNTDSTTSPHGHA